MASSPTTAVHGLLGGLEDEMKQAAAAVHLAHASEGTDILNAMDHLEAQAQEEAAHAEQENGQVHAQMVQLHQKLDFFMQNMQAAAQFQPGLVVEQAYDEAPESLAEDAVMP